jgi:hypothetical protein
MSTDHLYPYKGKEYPIRLLMQFTKFEMTPAFLSMRIRMNMKERYMPKEEAVIEAINRDPRSKHRVYKKSLKPKRPKVIKKAKDINFNNLHNLFKPITS